jgi:D-alanyl-D-alanine carboxypeptidase
VYALVNIGAPVLVFERSFSPDAFVYDDTRPPLAAPLYLAADLGNNYVFAAQGATTTVPIASLTKLLTALVATEYINLDMLATVPSEALVYTSRPRLIAGERRSVYGLLFPLLLESSNEAAETIARFYGRDSFITRMNEKAAAIGMQHSRFVDPSGAEAGNVSTAEDLFLLAKYLYYNRSFVLKISSGALTVSAYGGSGFVGLSNLNTFVGSEFFFGGKNGKTTAAHETNLSVFELPVGGAIRPVVVVVLGSPDEKVDSHALMEYVVNHL